MRRGDVCSCEHERRDHGTGTYMDGCYHFACGCPRFQPKGNKVVVVRRWRDDGPARAETDYESLILSEEDGHWEGPT
jgi:hypothetical protein